MSKRTHSEYFDDNTSSDKGSSKRIKIPEETSISDSFVTKSRRAYGIDYDDDFDFTRNIVFQTVDPSKSGDDDDEALARALQNSIDEQDARLVGDLSIVNTSNEKLPELILPEVQSGSSNGPYEDYPTNLSTKLYPQSSLSPVVDFDFDSRAARHSEFETLGKALDEIPSVVGTSSHDNEQFKNNPETSTVHGIDIPYHHRFLSGVYFSDFKSSTNNNTTEEFSPLLSSTTISYSPATASKATAKSSTSAQNNTIRKKPTSIEDEDVIDLHDDCENTTLVDSTYLTSSKIEQIPQQSKNNLLQIMPIQSATEGSESSVDHPTLSHQNSKRLQQVPGVNTSATSNDSLPSNNNGVVDSSSDQSSNDTVNNKKTRIFSDDITYKHLMCISSKSVGDLGTYQIVVRFDEKSPYTNKSDPSSKQWQTTITGKTDLKRLIELISDHTNLPITTVCFKKTLGDRQKIIPLSTKLPAVFDKITLQKPVSLFINGKEFLELDYNNMYTESGNELFREKKFEEALECYNTSLNHFPYDTRVLSNKSLCLIKLNKFDQAFRDLSLVISSDKTDGSYFEKALHRRAHAIYEMVKNLTSPSDELVNLVNSLVANTRVKDESLEVKLHYLCLKDMHNYLEKVGILADYATVVRKKEIELNDVKLIKSFHYLLHNAPKALEYCLIKKKEVKDLKSSTVFPSSIYSPENKDSSVIHTPLPFCSREWYDSEMARYEELFSVKLWKPFYDNNENINGKTMQSQELYKFIIFTTFKYLLSKPDFGNLLTNDINSKIFGKMLIYLAFGAGTPPKAYLYINNKSDETKIAMREYIHQNVIEYIHIQVRDFHFIVEFKQPASSTFSTTDSSYGAKENRVKHSSENFLIRVGDNLPAEISE